MSTQRHTSSPELIALLARLGAGGSVNPDLPNSLCVVASITNLRQIQQAHGSTFCTVVRHYVGERARTLCEERLGTATMSGDHILFVFDIRPTPQNSVPPPAPLTCILLERVLGMLGARPVVAGDAIAFPTISAKVVHFSDEPFDIDAAGDTRVLSGQPGRAWREQFIADTWIAEHMFDALLDSRLDFAFEPICDASGSGAVEYQEALLSEVVQKAAERRRVGARIGALERLGLARRLDCWVVEKAIGMLREHPNARIGCNLSAQSATLDAWWALILTTLNDEPDVARRLTIEITETVPLTEFGEARQFVRAFRSLGCRVALDDVGDGFSGIRNLLQLDVDIVKVDGSLIRDARVDDSGLVRFQKMVSLARTCAPMVVVEGVESESDARLARNSGATHLQGYLFDDVQRSQE